MSWGRDAHSEQLTIYYLSKEQAIEINRLLEAEGRIRDENGLERAMMAPQQAAHYEAVDLIPQAAILIERLLLNHPFVDGNKRTALVVGTAFLMLNGFDIEYKESVEELAFAKAIHDLIKTREGSHMVTWLLAHVQPYGGERKQVAQQVMRKFARDIEYLANS